MPLTEKEQKTFEDMFSEICVKDDAAFIDSLADLIFEMTGDVNFRMRLFKVSQRLEQE